MVIAVRQSLDVDGYRGYGRTEPIGPKLELHIRVQTLDHTEFLVCRSLAGRLLFAWLFKQLACFRHPCPTLAAEDNRP